MEFLNFNSVELLPNAKASAAFMVDSGKVFREDICTLLYPPFWRICYPPMEQKGLQTPASTEN